ncbi:excisionase family DNA-binding protein (plasmid) [Deinococcus sp. KNUC1210]|uniref:excisionase family DNA-binding protein n=1 Tax=Deinococcus sp. KNUC1210 TaxID=2917691 RepID=UPI001EF0F2DC|nr:excisionase family DNA-binding protein [Deinococcus sp. KNUC1210]ULH13977.1 excisionase family DNA-binding protein [Deinococcus sp. KNUC1210]
MTAPFIPTPDDTQAAQLQLDMLRAQAGRLPVRLAEVLDGLLQELAAGRAVQVITLEEEISTQQAAELLNVSRPYLVKLVESGALPHRKVGPRRRLHLQDVLAYRARLEAQRQAALQALADDLQELGLD